MTDISRRDALKGFGLASLAGALELTPPQLERALDHMAALEEGGGSEEGAQALQQFVPRFFTAGELRTVRVLADMIIPRDARSGSATDAKVPEYMDFLLADRDASDASKVSMRGGLAWMDREARKRFNTSFAGATVAQRRQILDDIAWPAKAPPHLSQGVAFFTRFRDLTASGFFSSQMGWRDLRYTGNVSRAGWEGCPPAALAKLNVSYDLMNPRTPGTPR